MELKGTRKLSESSKAGVLNKLRASAYLLPEHFLILILILMLMPADLLCKMSFAKIDKIDKHGSRTTDIRKVLDDAYETVPIRLFEQTLRDSAVERRTPPAGTPKQIRSCSRSGAFDRAPGDGLKV